MRDPRERSPSILERGREREKERVEKPKKKEDLGPTFDSAVDSYVNSLKKLTRPRVVPNPGLCFYLILSYLILSYLVFLSVLCFKLLWVAVHTFLHIRVSTV